MIAVFCGGGGHAERLVPLIAALTGRGLEVHVWTRADADGQIQAAGGICHDLYADYPIDAVDSESIPLPSRLVTFAAAYVEPLTAAVAALRPRLLVYDSFMVVAPLIARRLGIPYVGMRAGHAQLPAQAIDDMARDARVVTSRACLAAVDRLRRDHDVADASPFSYLANVSPHLNLYPEPASFIDDRVRAAFAPIAFFGSLAPEVRERRSSQSTPFTGAHRVRVYVSFGTVIWRYYAEVALAAMTVLSEVWASRDAEVLMSLGGYAAPAEIRRGLGRANVHIETYVDQWAALRQADLFVTHHGLSSTHEAVYHRVPMLSYPFFGDQPALAATCRTLGLAVPLSATAMAPLTASGVAERIAALSAERPGLDTRLAEARQSELATIADRPAVVDRMLALC